MHTMDCKLGCCTLVVLQDILNQLGMGKQGQPQLRQWVMSFQRSNLHLSVSLKNGTAAAANLAGLVADARAAEARGVRLEATLIYAQTTREVDELAAYLQQQGVSAVK
jgi:superfamily II DNA helicase RecQ